MIKLRPLTELTTEEIDQMNYLWLWDSLREHLRSHPCTNMSNQELESFVELIKKAALEKKIHIFAFLQKDLQL